MGPYVVRIRQTLVFAIRPSLPRRDRDLVCENRKKSNTPMTMNDHNRKKNTVVMISGPSKALRYRDLRFQANFLHFGPVQC